MSINPSIGATVTNLGKASSIEVDRILPEQEPKQFECSILKAGEEYRLQVRRGLIEFDYFQVDANGIIDKEHYGVRNTDLTSGTVTCVTKCYIYAPGFNLYKTGSKVGTTGIGVLDSEYLDNGYIKLEEGKDYWVFVYKITPDFPSGMPPLPPPSETYEQTAPQIAVMEAGTNEEQSINSGDDSNGSGNLVMYAYKSYKYVAPPGGILGADEGAGTTHTGYNGFYTWYNPIVMTGDPYSQTAYYEDYVAESVMSIYDLKIGYKETSCIRKDIAYIKWNAGLKRFQIFQINYGPVEIRQQPIGPIAVQFIEPDAPTLGWVGDEEGKGSQSCKAITDPIDGYTKALNNLSMCSAPSFIHEKLYQKPFETS